MVNRDLIRRVKATPSGVVWGRRAIRGDLRLLLTLVRDLDRSKELWEYSPVQPATGETGTEVDKVRSCHWFLDVAVRQDLVLL